MQNNEWKIYNYCIAFIDLLGQRDKYKNEGFLPQFTSEEERQAFKEKVIDAIGPILSLQNDAETMVGAAWTPNPEFKEILPLNQYEAYTNIKQNRIKRQRWSDGLVFFTSLGDPDILSSPLQIFTLFGLAGSLCFLGLARKQPIRGAIDISWGVELHDNELYGAAVAKAYELENYVAQYPRIVVGNRMIRYLEDHSKIMDNDIYSKCDSQFAQKCLNMILEDCDGHFFIHYLGDSFRECISKGLHSDIYQKAINFVRSEYENYRGMKDGKLAFRYSHLLSYFLAHPLMDRTPPTNI